MITTPAVAKYLPPLSNERKVALLLAAQLWVVAATVFSGFAIALQKWLSSPFPGASGPSVPTTLTVIVMRALTITLMYSVFGTIFKTFVVKLWGQRIERQAGRDRPVRLRQVFARDIWLSAFLGGSFQVLYSILFLLMVPVLAPTALAASRACIIVPLAVIEAITGNLRSHGKGWAQRLVWWLRLASSLAMTIAGAWLVVVMSNTNVFIKSGLLFFVLFGLLLTFGNLCAAIAEWQEWRGVHCAKVAAPVYTLARFMMFAATTVIMVVAWGWATNSFAVFRATIFMCLHRWYLLLPIALFWGITDLTRICVKSVVPATYMYIVGVSAVMIDAFTQAFMKWVKPDIYDNVPAGWLALSKVALAALVVIAGAVLYPHIKRDAPTPTVESPL